MTRITCVSYYWGANEFSRLADNLKGDCGTHKVKCCLVHKRWKKTYQEGINYKPSFILEMLEKYNSGVVYLDVDMKLHSYPKLFENIHDNDVMLLNWNYDRRVSNGVIDPCTLETSGGMMYFNNTPQAKKLLKLWQFEINNNPMMADDRILSITIQKYGAIQWCRFYWLPIEYFYIPEYYKHLKLKPVISHSRKLTPESNQSRVPKEYKIVKPVNKPYHVYSQDL